MKNVLFLHLLPASILLLIFSTQSSPAQPVEDTGSPSGLLLAPAPEFSQWVITFAYLAPSAGISAADTPSPTPPPSFHPDPTLPKITTTTKTHDILHEEVIDGRGTKYELWYEGQTLYCRNPSSGIWDEHDPIKDGPGTKNPLYVPMPANGFRDLEWISLENYAGTIKYRVSDCLVFTMVTPHSPHLFNRKSPINLVESLDSYALIDNATRLPIKVKVGGILRSYEFKDAPSEKLTLPADLTEQLRKSDEAVKTITHPMPRPY